MVEAPLPSEAVFFITSVLYKNMFHTRISKERLHGILPINLIEDSGSVKYSTLFAYKRCVGVI